MGAPGWPELAACTASMASARMALAWVWADMAGAVGVGVLAVSDMGVLESGVKRGGAETRAMAQNNGFYRPAHRRQRGPASEQRTSP